MNKSADMLSEQIDTCKNLLGIFLDERQVFLDKEHVNLKEILPLLQKKCHLAERLTEMKQTFNPYESNDGFESAIQPKVKRQLIRELGALLEQLLVIEHENELLIKQSIKKDTVRQRAGAAAFDRREHLSGKPEYQSVHR